jgi:hypothetical protein
MATESEEETQYITAEEFLDALQRINTTLTPLVGDFSMVLGRLEERLEDDDAHECPLDHAVYESLVQAKLRLAESVMWLRSALATKLASGVVDDGQLDLVRNFPHGDSKPN